MVHRGSLYFFFGTHCVLPGSMVLSAKQERNFITNRVYKELDSHE